MPNSTSIAHKSVDLSSLSPLETATAAISKKFGPLARFPVI